jgi:SAM-dependent methyltransferase
MKSLLNLPWLYKSFQVAIGAAKFRTELLSAHVRCQPGDRILDIGCGTADIRAGLGDVSYVGFDPSPKYIETARKSFPGSTFHVGSLEKPPALDSNFDIALAVGVLHHINDELASRLFGLASTQLRPSGRLVTADPVLAKSPGNGIANFLVRSDRGQHVRTQAEYERLALASFTGSVVSVFRSNLLRLPYNHCVLVCNV